MITLRRQRVEAFDEAQLLRWGTRHGALLRHGDEWRVGLGQVLGRGLATLSTARAVSDDLLRSFEVTGDSGPEGTGVVAYLSTPFDRDVPFEISIRAINIFQTPSGTWLTAPDGMWPELDEQEPEPLGSLVHSRYVPTPDEYAATVARAVGEIRRGEYSKVVLARSLHGQLNAPVDVASVAEQFAMREPACTLYSLPLPDGRTFVGASPELLVSVKSGAVACHPLAGTIATPGANSSADETSWLLGSHKNQYEHRVVVEDIMQRLADICEVVRADREPAIVTLSSIAHLGTWIEGKLPPESPAGVFDLLQRLHPTPAVGGVPTADALRAIGRLEHHARGHYAGAVGWCDQDGNGEWWVGIRGIMILHDTIEAWAGAGIVAESDPMAEREETAAKMAAILAGIQPS